MATKKLRINGYKIKRFSFLPMLLTVLASFYWAILKSVSPVFKPPVNTPEENKARLERDYRGALKINPMIDYKNTTEVSKKRFGILNND